jgi:hypothetical protein
MIHVPIKALRKRDEMRFQARRMTALVVTGLVTLSACDSFFESSSGAPPPRLSASLVENAPSSPTYTARVYVDHASHEFLGLVASDGASISFGGSPAAATYCAGAAGEQVFAVTSAKGTPSLTVILGDWAVDGGQPLVGPGSACATSAHFEQEESLVVSIPSAPSSPPVDAGASADGATPSDGSSTDIPTMQDAGVDVAADSGSDK